MKVNFVGWYGKHNVGDIALKESINQMSPDTENIFTTTAIDGADRYVLGGGDVIKKIYLDSLVGKEFSILGAGLGYESEISLLQGHKIKDVYLRSHADILVAKGAGIDAKYCPDLAFMLNTKKRETEVGAKKKALVILSDAMNPSCANKKASELAYAEYFKWELADALTYLNEWYDFRFMPLSGERKDMDLRCALDVMARMDKLSTHDYVPQPPTIEDALYAIANVDLVISMKFHGLVFSVLTGTPFVDIGLTRKTKVFTCDVDMGHLSVSPYSLTKDLFVSKVQRAENQNMSWTVHKVAEFKKILSDIELW